MDHFACSFIILQCECLSSEFPMRKALDVICKCLPHLVNSNTHFFPHLVTSLRNSSSIAFYHHGGQQATVTWLSLPELDHTCVYLYHSAWGVSTVGKCHVKCLPNFPIIWQWKKVILDAEIHGNRSARHTCMLVICILIRDKLQCCICFFTKQLLNISLALRKKNTSPSRWNCAIVHFVPEMHEKGLPIRH